MKKTIFLLILLCQFLSYSQTRPFITTWETTTVDETITIPTTGTGYDYTIDWGDGTIDTNQTGDATHTYVTAGAQAISISGDFPIIFFNNTGDKEKILTIEQWGDIEWASMSSAFYGCTNLNITNTTIDSPDLSLVTDMSSMFREATVFDGNISNWDVSNVTTMLYLFSEATSFNQNLSSWDVSSVTNMNLMFRVASSFNQPLDWIDTSSVTGMAYMFYGATSFNQDISNWDVSNVISMIYLFSNATSFNQDLSSWDVSNVTNMTFMFSEATSFNQLLDWEDTSSVTSMTYMFRGATSFNQDISSWNVSNVTTMIYMFLEAIAFNQDLSSWDVSNVTNMTFMFDNVTLSVENYDAILKGWNTQTLQTKVTFTGGNNQYCTAETERQSIVDTFGWRITDGGKAATPIITAITDINAEGYYTLPVITGTDLSGNEKYYTATGGTGTEYSAGDVLAYDASTTYPITLYAYDTGNSCEESEEVSFTVTLTELISFKPFITTWQTTTANESITIPTSGIGYDYTIDWGDGTIESNQTGNTTHTYTTAGIYTVIILEDFPRIYFHPSSSPAGNSEKIITIEQWGDIEWTSMSYAFYQCSNLNITNTSIDTPDLSGVTNMGDMFNGASVFNYDISNWNVSNVTSIRFIFNGASSFNQPLDWDVSNVTNMSGVFSRASAFDQDISNWNVSYNVTDMSSMFSEATSFNQDLSSWDVSNVTGMSYMFSEATSFNQLLDWEDTSSVTDMSFMFSGATSFNQDLSNWDVSSVTDMSRMFSEATSFNQPLVWDVSDVTNIGFMFDNAALFDQYLSSWDVSNVTSMTRIFQGVTLSTANYDAILKGWSSQTLQTGVSFYVGNSQYCDAETERQSIIDNYRW